MKAIRVHEFGGPEVLKFEDAPDLQPGATQVLMRIRAAGVNPVDTYVRAGTYSIKPALPYTPGNDGAGEILAVGSSVKQFRDGDRVYTSGSSSGTYAEQAVCEANRIHRLPAQASFEEGAAMGIAYGTAYHAMFHRGATKPGETVLIHGASGGVGSAAVQLARAAGMTVIGTAGSESGMKLVKQEGAHHVLNHNSQGYLDELMKLTGDRGADVILEMLANKNLGKDLTVLAKKGRIVVIGSRGPVEINPRDAMTRDADIRGMMLWLITDQERQTIHGALTNGLENGTLHPVIGQKIPLAEAARAQVEVMKPSGAYGKIVLLP